MNQDRRNFLTQASGVAGLGSILFGSASGAAETLPTELPIKAIAFDAFPIFDPRSVFATVKQEFPDQGEELRKLWFSKTFAYTWLRTAAGRYRDFQQITKDALLFAANDLGLELPAKKSKTILSSLHTMDVWPDVKPALEQLRSNNIRLVFLSNMTEAMLRSNMKNAGIEQHFESVLSTDRAQEFKPSQAAYQLGPDALDLPKEEIAFAAFAGWDAVGAQWFGYQSAWINRLGFPPEELGTAPKHTGKDLSTLVNLALVRLKR